MCLADEFLAESNKIRFVAGSTLCTSIPMKDEVEGLVSAKGGRKSELLPRDIAILVGWRNALRALLTEPEYSSEPIDAAESLSNVRTMCGVARTFDCEHMTVSDKVEALSAMINFAISRSVHFSYKRFVEEFEYAV